MVEKQTTHSAGLAATIRHDFLSSIVVFLVALPLCMGIAIASGAPVSAGLITGVVGGLVVGWISGCPLQVSGPAAGLTVIVYEAVERFGLEMLGLVVLMAGVLQLAAGLLRLGQWFRAVSPAVIKGMLAGIGFLILGSQFHVMIDDTPKQNGLANLATIPQAIQKSLGRPAYRDRRQQQLRSRTLRDVGELRRRQVKIEERLHELVASAPVGEAASLAAPSQLDQLRGEQMEVVQSIQQVLRQLDQLKPNGDGAASQDQPTSQIRVLAMGTLSRNQAAAAALSGGDVEQALESQSQAVESFETLLASLKDHYLAAHLGVVTIVLIILWQFVVPQRLRVVPAPLVAVVVATAVAGIWSFPVLYVEVPDNIWADVRLPSRGLFSNAPWSELWPAAVLMAVVASAETLLCATAVDQLHSGPRTKYDRELCAQGAGNMICGLLGALPMTGVIVRSSANVQAGGRTRFSTILHGAWLLLFVSALAFLLRMIPTASLAAILVYTGYKLIDVKSIRELRQYGWGEVMIYAATVGTIVYSDLLTGVLVGIGLSAVKLLYRFSHLDSRLQVEPDQRQAVLSLYGAATFIRLPRLATELEKVPAAAELHVDFEHLDYIDHACLDLLMTWAKQHQSTGGKLVIDWESLHARFHREPTSRSDANRNVAARKLAAPPPRD